MATVLDITDDNTGSEFTLAGGWAWAHCDTHTGGTWTLQVKSPGEVWTDADDVAFTGVDIIRFQMYPGALCRFHGGSSGGRIYCTSVL